MGGKAGKSGILTIIRFLLMPRLRQPQANKEVKVRVEGRVITVLPDTKYKVEIDVQGIKHMLTGYISGKMRQNYIKVQEGDRVVVEVSPYDLSIGRIVYNAKRDAAKLAAHLAARPEQPTV